MPKPATAKNGKRVALIGAGPASLTVARDLLPLGYDVTIYDGDANAGGMMRTQIPKFRLPETRSEEHTSELQSRVDMSYAVFCLKMQRIIHRETRLSIGIQRNPQRTLHITR